MNVCFMGILPMVVETFNEKPQMLTSWWHSRKSQGIAEVSRTFPTIHISTKFHVHQCSCWNMVWTHRQSLSSLHKTHQAILQMSQPSYTIYSKQASGNSTVAITAFQVYKPLIIVHPFVWCPTRKQTQIKTRSHGTEAIRCFKSLCCD